MPSPFPHLPTAQRGTVRVLEHASENLKGNPWGDPHVREIRVYTPPGSDGAGLPAILLLPAFAGSGEAMQARGLSEVPMSSRIDRLIAGGCPPFVAVIPDSMTRLGGSQYVDSPGIGRYASWITGEVVPFVEATFRTSGAWGVAGRSSGGFGALHLALSHPGRFQAVASHAGDMGFDLCYAGDLLSGFRGLRAAGSPEAFPERFWSKENPGGDDFAGLNLLCMSCAYATSSVEPAGVNRSWLPVDPETGEVRYGILRAWEAFDPVRRDLEPLRDLRLLLLDAGDRDEHGLQFGARRLVSRLNGAGIAHTYEEFPGTHRGTSHRWDVSLPRLSAALR